MGDSITSPEFIADSNQGSIPRHMLNTSGSHSRSDESVQDNGQTPYGLDRLLKELERLKPSARKVENSLLMSSSTVATFKRIDLDDTIQEVTIENLTGQTVSVYLGAQGEAPQQAAYFTVKTNTCKRFTLPSAAAASITVICPTDGGGPLPVRIMVSNQDHGYAVYAL